jgi:hypothetical protein
MIGFSAAVEVARGEADAAASGDDIAPAAATLGVADGAGEGDALAEGDGFGDGEAVADGVGEGDGGAVGTSVTSGCDPVTCGTGVTWGTEVAPSSGSVPRFWNAETSAPIPSPATITPMISAAIGSGPPPPVPPALDRGEGDD